MSEGVTNELNIAKELHRYLIGTGGSTIKKLQADSGAKIQIPKADDPPNTPVTVQGSPDQVEKAVKAINEIVAEHSKDKKGKKTDKEEDKDKGRGRSPSMVERMLGLFGKKEKEEEPYDLEKSTAETEKLYQKYQKDVDKHAQLRAKYFEESKVAFDKGEKAKAKELSEKGKHEGELMQQAQKKASREIFKHKNAKYKDGLTMDFHGLHTDDAIEILTEKLEALKVKRSKMKEAMTVTVITGAGIHSDEEGPKIKPAIFKLLKEKGLEYNEISNGSISVTL